jgi:hypothetical protein
LLSKKWIADAFANYQFIQKNLDLSSVSTLLNLTEIEFRKHSSWESKLTGNGLHLNLGPTAKPNNIGILKYQFENWIFKSFSGNRHSLNGYFKLQNWTFQNQGSYLKVMIHSALRILLETNLKFGFI